MRWSSYTSNPRSTLLTILLIGAAVLFQNCNRDDDAIEPTRKYHCPQENFSNDCDAYKDIEKSLGYGHIGFEAAAPTFTPNNSDEIIFTYDNNEDKLEPSQIIRYNWRTQEKTVLIEESPMIHAYDISPNDWVCAEVSSGPIIYFHLDSPSTTLKEIPLKEGIVRDPAWLSDGKTIVYLADSSDLQFNLVSFDIETEQVDIVPVEIPNVRPIDLIVKSMSPEDQLLALVGTEGFYKVDFHDMTKAEHFMSPEDITLPAGTVSILVNPTRMYYAGPKLISYGENHQEYGIRDLCFRHEDIKYMDVSDDEKYIVYMFEYPVEFSGGKQILASKLRIIDIENCKEYDINPFE